MAEYLVLPIIVGVITLIIGIIIIFAWSKRHKDFIDSAEMITEGMSKEEVLNIMGTPTSEEKDGQKLILIWEKSQWKGIQHGGTVTRGIKVVIVNNKVISVSNKNLDKSTFW